MQILHWAETIFLILSLVNYREAKIFYLFLNSCTFAPKEKRSTSLMVRLRLVALLMIYSSQVLTS